MTKLTNRDRMLKVIEILYRETDVNHQLKLHELKEAIELETNLDVGGDKGLRSDLDTLVQSKTFSVVMNHDGEGLPMFYSYQERLFEVNELRLLLDAVTSARFISNTDTYRLIDKIKKLASKHAAKDLENKVLIDKTVKSKNKYMKFYINNIHLAITERKLIQFKYGKYNTDKEFVLSRKGIYYLVQPYALYWNNDFYYLIGKYGEEEQIRHYRIDRMVDVQKTDVHFTFDESFNMTEYVNQLFHMYAGEEKYIEIVFDNHLINVIIDRFGLKADIKKYDEHSFKLKTKAVISEGLIRWLLTWGSDAKVLNPKTLVDKMAEEAEKMYRLYLN
ncbi:MULTISPECIES: helix-turn-helix transcriptional regulator [Bacillaceae]|uniref:WYL domain-containing protein n=1 Tax=Evansella alkalicola TaxID=745819 RepID=A0ABS6JQ90_9BACI|nr:MULTISPECIES: WYL domain-containing protein [Bacillaceae]MBU9720271.1 WYL domain-containing protein [Bacillus alkalicola]